jgi:hypothetical protein
VVAGVNGIVIAIANIKRESVCGNVLHSSTVENRQDWMV